MDFGEIPEKKPRAVKECQQRSVMIGGKRVKAGLDISEVLLEEWPYPRRGVCGPARANWWGRAAAPSYHLVAALPRIAGVRRGCCQHTKRCVATGRRHKRRE